MFNCLMIHGLQSMNWVDFEGPRKVIGIFVGKTSGEAYVDESLQVGNSGKGMYVPCTCTSKDDFS